MELQEDVTNFSFEQPASQKLNYLKADGSIAYKNTYVRIKSKEYLDIVCSACESPVIIIPFDVCDLEQRKKVFKMAKKEKIKFASRFELLDSLDDENDE
jgi:hypothetical protein